MNSTIPMAGVEKKTRPCAFAGKRDSSYSNLQLTLCTGSKNNNKNNIQL